MTKNVKGKDTMYYIHCLIGFMFIFFFRLLPAPEPITGLGMQVLGVFFGLIYMWTFVDTIWPSILGLVGLTLTDYGTIYEVTMKSFGNSTAAMLFLFLGIVVVIEQSGLATWFANKFLGIKFFNGKPWLFTLSLLIFLSTLASFCNMFLIVFTFWAVFDKICEKTGYQKGETYVSVMLIGILIFAALGGIMVPFNGMAIIANSAYIQMGREGFVYAKYIPHVATMLYSSIIVYVAMMRFVFRADVNKLRNFDTSTLAEEIKPLNKRQKVLAVCIIIVVVLLLMPGMIPTTNVFGGILTKLQVTGILMAGFAGLCFLKIDGEPMLDWNKASGHINWNLFFIIATAMAVSGAITAEGTGVQPALLTLLQPLTSNLSPIMFIVLLAVVSVILTNIFNNIVICMVMLSILSAYATAYTVNEPVALTILTVCACLGYMLPSSSVSGAILHGNDYLSAAEIYKYLFAVLAAITLVIIFIGVGLGFVLYPM